MDTIYATPMGAIPDLLIPLKPFAAHGLRLFAVEDDPVFARMLRRAAESTGASLDIFDPDRDFNNLPQDGDYDAAIVDYNLGYLNGAQIAALYSDTPVLLTSISALLERETKPWPRSVRAFVCKRRGVKGLIMAAAELAAAVTWKEGL
jgi:CheY-like chemotaxis protein